MHVLELLGPGFEVRSGALQIGGMVVDAVDEALPGALVFCLSLDRAPSIPEQRR